MIEIQNVTKSFGPTTVIPGLSLTIPQGQIHILLGSSGCGKTTLLRMIAGLTTPDSGQVTLGSDHVGAMSVRQISDRVGYVIQEGGLLPHMTAAENVLLPVRIRGGDLVAARDRLNELAATVELSTSQLRRYPHQLSGGQRQRVALLRGLILDQDIILLDEPLSALDPIVRMNLQRHLKMLFNKLKKTVVLVTHDLNVASYLGDVISLLDHGEIIQQGRFEDLQKNPTNIFVSEFIRAQTPRNEVSA